MRATIIERPNGISNDAGCRSSKSFVRVVRDNFRTSILRTSAGELRWEHSNDAVGTVDKEAVGPSGHWDDRDCSAR